MAENSNIEWTDHTFNGWEGCTKVGPGCDHCYAETRNARFAGGTAINWGPGAPRRRTSESNWHQPFKWNAEAARLGIRYRVFCASLADVFDNEVDPRWRADLFDLIVTTPNLDWLLLTKRIGNVVGMLPPLINPFDKIFPNVWIGATIVNQAEADRDIPKLLQVPAAKRFLSMEPLLGPVNLTDISDGHADSTIPREYWGDGFDTEDSPPAVGHNCLTGERWQRFGEWYEDGQRIDWVIVGGESGPGARPMHPDWARSLRDQCQAAGVPFLFKQWGEWLPINQQTEEFHRGLYRSNRQAVRGESQKSVDDHYGKSCTVERCVIQANGSVIDMLAKPAFTEGAGSMLTFRVGKKAAGRLLDGRTWDGVPT